MNLMLGAGTSILRPNLPECLILVHMAMKMKRCGALIIIGQALGKEKS